MLCDWDRFPSDRTAMNFGANSVTGVQREIKRNLTWTPNHIPTPPLPLPLALNVYRVSFNGFTPAYAPPRAASSSKAAAAASVRGSSKSARAIAGLEVRVSE